MVEPRKIDIMAGGASLAPKRCSLLAVATVALSISAWSCTAFTTFTRKVMNISLRFGSSLGERRLTPVSVENDQLLCFPLPLIPAKGFS
ncbi:hypothetical protein FQZ97_1073510 [compost metagenome]